MGLHNGTLGNSDPHVLTVSFLHVDIFCDATTEIHGHGAIPAVLTADVVTSVHCPYATWDATEL